MRNALVLVVILVLVACHFVVSSKDTSRRQRQPTLSSVGSNAQNDTSNKTGRAINTSQSSSNRVPPTNGEGASSGDEDSNGDINFENSPNPEDFSESGIQFPDELPSVRSTPAPPRRIPLEFLVKIGKETEIKTFLTKYVKNVKLQKDNKTQEEYLTDSNGNPYLDSYQEKIVLTPVHETKTVSPTEANQPITRSQPAGRSGTFQPNLNTVHDSKSHRMNVLTLEFCTPELKTVPIPVTVAPHIHFIPKCARVERCGGCCQTDLLTCEPTTVDTIEQTIKKFVYVGGDKLEYLEDETVQIEKHTGCECKCRTKKHHCNKFVHTYDEKQCSCVCKDQYQKGWDECDRNPMKIWDHSMCLCLCREISDCSSGYYYDLSSCECKQGNEPKWQNMLKRRSQFTQ